MKFEYRKIYWGESLTEEEKEAFETTADRLFRKDIVGLPVFCCEEYRTFFTDKDNKIDIGNDRSEDKNYIRLSMRYQDAFSDGMDSTDWKIYFCPFCGEKFEFECIGEFEEVRKNKQITKIWTETRTSLKKLKSAMKKTDSIRRKNAQKKEIYYS